MRPRLRGTVGGLLAVAFVALLAACGSSSSSSNSGASSASGSGKTVSMAMILPCATSDPWCRQGDQAAKRLAPQGIITLKETVGAPQDTAAAEQVIRQYAQSGVSLVVAYSTLQDATAPVAQKFPKTNFATFGIKPTNNVALFDEPIYQASYLAGILAGGITKSHVISGVAGQDIPLCHAEMLAFQAGAKTVNPNIRQVTTYIGDWNDVAKSQQAVSGQIDQKSDVVLACGGAQANGMAQAIKARNVSGFGYVGDISPQAPKNMVGTIIYDPYPYLKAMAEAVKAGTFEPAKLYSFGLRQGGVSLQLNPQYSAAKIPAAVMAKMEKVRAQIMAGKFNVPYVPTGNG
jgi:basic membrane protein A and related proteins